MNITVEGGKSKKLLTGGKYCPEDITVTAEGNNLAFEETITVASSCTNGYQMHNTLKAVVKEGATCTLFFWNGDVETAANNQFLFGVIWNTSYIQYCRYRDGNYNYVLSGESVYDVVLTAGDTVRVVTVI